MIDDYTLGRYAEDTAARYLVSLGWRILERNARNKYGELDIIAEDPKSDELVIVEVRCRTENKFQSATDSVYGHKMNILKRSGSLYMESIGWEGFWRIDVVGITVNDRNNLEDWTIEHIRDITG